MSGQRFKNELRGSDEGADFDLDSFLDEKAQPQPNEKTSDTKRNSFSNFIKNSFLVLGLSLFALLYFNNWSITQVYGNIFGIEKYQAQSPDPVVFNQGTTPVTPVSPITSAEVNTEGLEAFENLEVLESLEALEGLEALESLEGLADLENLSKLSVLGELGNLAIFGDPDNIQVIPTSDAQNNAFPTSLEDCSAKLEEAEIKSNFESETIGELYEAKVPVSVLKILNDLNILDELEISDLIEGYKQKEN